MKEQKISLVNMEISRVSDGLAVRDFLEGKMKVYFIQHSSFLVEFEEFHLLFDYYGGKLPKVIGQKPLFVFASHVHADHYNPVIFQLDGKETTYILSNDIPVEPKQNIHLLGKNQRASYTTPTGKMEVVTYPSTDEGVAFIIDVAGVRLYFAGDLNYWYWEGEPKEWNLGQERDYRAALEQIHSQVERDKKGVDIAFVVLDNRQGRHYNLGMDAFIEKVGAKYIFPMHLNGSFSLIDRYIDGEKDKKKSIVRLEKENQCVEVSI